MTERKPDWSELRSHVLSHPGMDGSMQVWKVRITSREKTAKLGEVGSFDTRKKIELSRNAELKGQERKTSFGEYVSYSIPKPSKYG